MTNREIIERLRKRIEEILRQYDPPGSRKPHASTARSGAEAGGGYGGYPEVQTQTAGRDGFRVYTSVYAAGANQWLQPTPIDAILLLAGSEESRLAPDSLALFLDIETTGLSGAGTVAFLVGLGRWTDKGFEIAQFFLEDRDSEPDMLAEVGAQIGSAQVLVTFNGKPFDVPVLQTRSIINGMPRLASGLESRFHLDLYSAVRKLGKHPLYGMSLKECVERFPGIRRLHDIPGRMIPALYFMYERDGDVSVLDQVFRHNRLDILDMVVLLRYLHCLFTQGYEWCDDSCALAGIGKFYAARGQMEPAARFLTAAVGNSHRSPPETRAAHSRLLATVLRRQGDWDKAASIWKTLIGSSQAGYEDYLWLARYYEVCLGDIRTSFRIILEYIEHCRESGSPVPEPVASRKRRLARIISATHS
ncbi:MAG: ribonuclease H-like domain-containing protein [Bacillota bacterium]|nr:ribonuclease H-like domain-containing protein [Candidatus Fermentithermobacillaceae bacterium]